MPPGPLTVIRKRRAAQAAGHHGCAAAFKRKGSNDAPAVRPLFEEIAHAAKIAFAFFPNIGGKENCGRRMDACITQGGSDSQQTGETGSVIARSPGPSMRGCRCPSTGSQRCPDRKHCVQMSRQQNDGEDR